MPKYRLSYFNGRGFTEMARLVFAQAGVDFEDVRLDRTTWAEFRPKTPFGQIPTLEVDGVMIADSAVIVRYLGKQFGLAGKNPIEEAQVDMQMAAAYDLAKPCQQMYGEKMEGEKKAELMKKFLEEAVPKYLSKFDATLGASKSGFLVGAGVSYADIALYNFMFWISTIIPADVYAKYPNVQKHSKKIESLPKIAAWIKKRPVTEY